MYKGKRGEKTGVGEGGRPGGEVEDGGQGLDSNPSRPLSPRVEHPQAREKRRGRLTRGTPQPRPRRVLPNAHATAFVAHIHPLSRSNPTCRVHIASSARPLFPRARSVRDTATQNNECLLPRACKDAQICGARCRQSASVLDATMTESVPPSPCHPRQCRDPNNVALLLL